MLHWHWDRLGCGARYDGGSCAGCGTGRRVHRMQERRILRQQRGRRGSRCGAAALARRLRSGAGEIGGSIGTNVAEVSTGQRSFWASAMLCSPEGR